MTDGDAFKVPTSSTGRVLVVDDIHDNREILARRLERSGFTVVQAAGGLEALQQVATQVFDLILLDVVMPEVDGLEVLRRIRLEHSAALLPVIMVTAQTQSSDVVQALKLGANDYVTKPVDFSILFARVEAHVERKRAKEQLIAANEALQANLTQMAAAMEAALAGERSKDEFLANMSHEMRTPLNGVLGLASVLASTPLNSEQAALLEVITASASSLERLLGDVLDRARVETGQVRIRHEAFDLGSCVRSVAGLFRTCAEQRGLELLVDVLPEAEGEFCGDQIRVRQVLTNLLSNACKFTEAGEISLTVSRRENRLCFDVRDTGIGFPSHVGEVIFGRFVQADGSVQRRFGGTGLGLAISRDLAHLMGGSLCCSSEPGQGSTFTLELPVRAAANKTLFEDESVQIDVNDARLLINVKLTGQATGADVSAAISQLFLGRPELTAFDMIFDMLDYCGDVEAEDVTRIAAAYASCKPDPTVRCRTAFVTIDANFNLWAAAMDHQCPGREHRAFRNFDQAKAFLARDERSAA